MSQCVPSWELDDAANHDPPPSRLPFNGANNSNTKYADTQNPPEETMLDYEVAELTWENGQLAMHGLGPPRAAKPAASSKYTWDKPIGGGTLESIVNQATGLPPPGKTIATPAPPSDDLLPWFDHHRAAAGAATLTMDALVPSAWAAAAAADSTDELYSDRVPDTAVGSSTRVESSSPARKDVAGPERGEDGAAGGVRNKRNKASLSGVFDGNSWNRTASTTRSGGRQVTMDDTCEIDLSSQENTSYGKSLSSDSKLAATTLDDHDSVSHGRNELQREAGNGNEKKANTARSSISTKRSRAAAIHNQSERKRRDRINQRMKTLQKLVPNSSKTDKASMLDEVIEYLKQLQAQVQMMNKMSSFSQMMMPMGMQQLQMAMMAQMGMGLGMGMGVMDMNAAIARQPQTTAGMASLLHPAAAAFLTVPTQWDAAAAAAPAVVPDPFAAFLACQTQPQPMTLDAYNRMATMCQQLHQQQQAAAAAAAAAAAPPHSRAS